MADSDIVITEILYDAPNGPGINDNDHEWVEITNTGGDPVSLNGWTLDDSNTTNSGVGTFPDVTLNAGDVAIFYNDDITEAEFIAMYNPEPGTILIPVSGWQPLNNGGGDTVNLISDDDVTIQSITYPDDASAGESLRYDTDGNYLGEGTPNPGVVCFTLGALIATQDGEILIEDLMPGDLVKTKDHGMQPIRWIGRRIVEVQEMNAHPELRPVLISQSAMGKGVPERDTWVSQEHRIFIESTLSTLLFGEPRVLAASKGLVNDHSIRVDQGTTPVEYFHILFDQHEVIFADGLASESFHPVATGLNNLDAAARHELETLFPQLGQHAIPAAYPQLSPAEAALLMR